MHYLISFGFVDNCSRIFNVSVVVVVDIIIFLMSFFIRYDLRREERTNLSGWTNLNIYEVWPIGWSTSILSAVFSASSSWAHFSASSAKIENNILPILPIGGTVEDILVDASHHQLELMDIGLIVELIVEQGACWSAEHWGLSWSWLPFQWSTLGYDRHRDCYPLCGLLCS